MNRWLRQWWLIGAFVAPWCFAAHCAPRPTVVELYTSQGCSSCPPADALLGELTHERNVLALAFHVDYWDDQGWIDRFASPAATQRQQRYGQTLKLASVFTPQAIIDGQRSLVGSDRSAILSQLRGAHEGIAVTITAQGDDLEVDLAPGNAQAGADVLLLAVLPEAQTAVAHGENGGRKLQEFNIVRATYTLGTWNGDAHRYTVARSSLPKDATEVAVLVQQAGQRSILGAASYSWR
ncbi:MAG TPA: DUF1223 domain-containing protein [Steroidobacteraceae bacterium]|jgi:hypothetical protein